ncbi:hypothetical protein [Nesterenkonia pannonica]|uniref:hypothetical protein n=1 Tax=Nesterenkonia pannonica TaxID=1548602 RepID=UPI002164D92C|nr:hypothetical protein [Nesterenkonia pannonica]
MSSEVSADAPALYPVPAQHRTGRAFETDRAELLEEGPEGAWVSDVLAGCVRRTIPWAPTTRAPQRNAGAHG